MPPAERELRPAVDEHHQRPVFTAARDVAGRMAGSGDGVLGQLTPGPRARHRQPSSPGGGAYARSGMKSRAEQQRWASARWHRSHLGGKRHQPLTEPAVSPCTMYFWKRRTSRTAGKAPRKPEAAMTE